MFGIGWTEFVLVALVLLIFVGPKHLPGLLRKFAEVVGELKSASRELREQIEEEIRDIESPARAVRDLGRELMKDVPSPYDEGRKFKQAVEQEIKEAVEPPEERLPIAEREKGATPATDETPKEVASSKPVGTKGEG